MKPRKYNNTYINKFFSTLIQAHIHTPTPSHRHTLTHTHTYITSNYTAFMNSIIVYAQRYLFRNFCIMYT